MPVVVFDLGGVLVRIARTWGQAAALAQVAIAPDRVLEPLTAFPGLDQLQEAALNDESYAETLGEWLQCTSEQALRVHGSILMEEYPGVAELVRSLHPTACLSNTNALHWQEMAESGRFPTVAGLNLRGLSYEMRLNKPDPQIYQEFERLSGVASSEHLFFDDTLANVNAALEVGWRAYWIDHAADPATQMRNVLMNQGLTVQ